MREKENDGVKREKIEKGGEEKGRISIGLLASCLLSSVLSSF